MSAAPQEAQEVEVTAFAPLDCEHEFPVMVQIAGVTGTLTIRAQRVSTIAREIRLLRQNGMLVEQPQASSMNGDTPPLCPVHNRAMKPSKKPGAWYCSAKVGEGYCDQKVG